MAQRAAQLVTEALTSSAPAVRVSALAIDALVSVDTSVRVDQASIEVLTAYPVTTAAPRRVSQLAVEVLSRFPAPVTIGYTGTDFSASVAGTSDPSTAITVSQGATALGTTTSDSSGNWSLALTLAPGAHTVTATDGYSSASTTFTLYAHVTAVLIGPDPTTTGTIAGNAPPSELLTISEGNEVLGQTESETDGSWTFSPLGLAAGLHTVQVTDGRSTATVAFVFSIVPVIVPDAVGHLKWDTGSASADNVSSQSTIFGTGTPGLLVTITQDGVVVGSVMPDGTGYWEFDPDPEGGSYLYDCRQSDGTGFIFEATFTRPYSTSSFLKGFLNLLPSGPAWPKNSDSMLSRALRPLMRTFTQNGGRAQDVLTETFPSTTRELLPEWEASLGLSAGTQTVVQRQAAVTAKFALLGGQSIPYIEHFASLLGYTITITEDSAFRVGVDPITKGITSLYAPFAWRVHAPLAAQGSSLEAQIRQFAPAQTRVGFTYS